MNSMSIHRFKCSKELNDEIINFSQVHKFDTTETLKEQFDVWMKTPKMVSIVETERSYLQRYNYQSQIDSKIFKSIKYYYIKKFLEPQQDIEHKERIVNRLPTEIKELIQNDITQRFENDYTFKPSNTYDSFRKTLTDEMMKDTTEMAVKKCYKNQYYQIKHKKYASTLNAE